MCIRDRDEPAEKYDPELDADLDQEIYEKYQSDLYGTLVSLTSGESKSILRSLVEGGGRQDGFKALYIFGRRFETRTAASLLFSYREVIRPKIVKDVTQVPAAIYAWEAKVSQLHQRFNKT